MENCWYKNICEDVDTENCGGECHTFKGMLNCFVASNIPTTLWHKFNLTTPKVDSQAYAKLAEVKENIVNFVDNGHNIIITSANCGNGKTRWAIKLGQKCIEKLWSSCVSTPPVFYMYMPDLLLASRRAMSGGKLFDKYLNSLRYAKLVIWDDIGNTAFTNYDMITLQAVIEGRINEGLSNIFTTNVPEEEIIKNIGERLYDRLYKLSTLIEFKAGSMRSIND